MSFGLIFASWEMPAILNGAKWQSRELPDRLRAIPSPGDELFVKEPWRVARSLDDLSARKLPRTLEGRRGDGGIHYEGDGPALWRVGKLREASVMPQWASRLSLVVASVRPLSLHAITDEDAQAEGCKDVRDFARYWDRLHFRSGTRWDNNPVVVAIAFKANLRALRRIA